MPGWILEARVLSGATDSSSLAYRGQAVQPAGHLLSAGHLDDHHGGGDGLCWVREADPREEGRVLPRAMLSRQE